MASGARFEVVPLARTGRRAVARQPSPPDSAPDLVRQDEATTTLLFRFSAMTFDGQRFHDDFPYATEVEGYAGLVVHGPIQANLLLNLADAPGRLPRSFRYRGVSPMIADRFFRWLGGGGPWTSPASPSTLAEAPA